MALFLFDIDGTLVRMGGAGSRSMNLAFQEIYGIRGAFQGIDFRGGLDPVLVRAVMLRTGIVEGPGDMERFRDVFIRTLDSAVRPGSPSQETCPGVRSALSTLSALGPLGLVTGNWSEGARVKLQVFDLWEPFERFGFLGAFGEDGPDRATLVSVAVARARAMALLHEPVVLFGDTPQDVEAARKKGAIAVALRTGWCSESELQEARPDLLIQDLESGLPSVLTLLQRANHASSATD